MSKSASPLMLPSLQAEELVSYREEIVNGRLEIWVETRCVPWTPERLRRWHEKHEAEEREKRKARPRPRAAKRPHSTKRKRVA